MVSNSLMKTIAVGKDFSELPMGRYHPKDGQTSGQRFREELLVPLLREPGNLTVIIDDVEGYGSSFLDESFGGLVREGYFTPQQLQEKLVISLTNPNFEFYRKMIWRYIDAARQRVA